jgi:hypothetical protein
LLQSAGAWGPGRTLAINGRSIYSQVMYRTVSSPP